MKTPTSPSKRRPARRKLTRRQKGFALISVLTILSLLALIAVGLLTLANVESRRNGVSSAQEEAQANARFALQMAIAELQAHLGTDRAITATAGAGVLTVADLNEDATGGNRFLRNYIGVWEAAADPRNDDGRFEYIPGETAVYRDEGAETFDDQSIFKRWLVSNADYDAIQRENFFAGAGSVEDINFTEVTFNSDIKGEEKPVELVGVNTVGQNGERIFAGAVPIQRTDGDGQERPGGRYAWWVGDNNMKAYVRAKDVPARQNDLTAAEIAYRTGAPGAYGAETLADSSAPLITEPNTEVSDQLISYNQLGALQQNDTIAVQENFHDVTTFADSLLVDVTSGGLRKDLSLMLENDPPGGDWDGTIIKGNPPRGPYGFTALSEHGEYDTGNWLNLYEHYNVHRDTSDILLRRSDTNGTTILPPDSLTSSVWSRAHYPFWNSQRKTLTPVIVRSAMMLSIGAESLNSSRTDSNVRQFYDRVSPENGNTPVPDPANPDRFVANEYILTFHALPMITLWNPYNVAMRVDGFRAYTNGAAVSHIIKVGSGRRLSFEWNERSSTTDSAAPSRGILVGQNFTLEPGEMRTFFSTKDFQNQRFDFWAIGESARSPNRIDVDFDPGSGPLDAGFVRNSISREGSHGEGDAGGANNVFARVLGLWGDTTDTITIQTRPFLPEGERSGDQDPNTDGLQGLIYYADYYSFQTTLQTFPMPNNPSARVVPNASIREVDSAKLQGKLVWRNDADSPVTRALNNAIQTQTFNMSSLTSGRKIPFMLVDTRLKSTDFNTNSNPENPNLTWLHNIPSHGFFGITSEGTEKTLGRGQTSDVITASLAQATTCEFNQVGSLNEAFQFHQMDRIGSRLAIYGGNSYGQNGQNRVIAAEIPLVPIQSIGQLQHWPQVPIDSTRWANVSLQNYAIGNSYASPLLDPDEVMFPREAPQNPLTASDGSWRVWLDLRVDNADPRVRQRPDLDGVAWFAGVNGSGPYTEHFKPIRHIDRSWVANTLLFDDFFFSGLANYEGRYIRKTGEELSLDDVLDQFTNGEPVLPNTRYRYTPHGRESTEVISDLDDPEDGYKNAAYYITLEGGFNINSLSVRAWKTFLASNLQKRFPVLADDARPVAAGSYEVSDGVKYIIPKFNVGVETGNNGRTQWLEQNSITEAELNELAEEIVAEVSRRGPFRSIAEFVNRRVDRSSGNSEDNMALRGPLQQALDKVVNKRGNPLSANAIQNNSYKFEAAALLPSNAGTPEHIMQADLLQSIGPLMQARSDSFTIRAYGESADGSARAWCEAVVVRSHDYVDQSVEERPDARVNELQSEINRKFGRQFRQVSFRWLAPSSI